MDPSVQRFIHETEGFASLKYHLLVVPNKLHRRAMLERWPEFSGDMVAFKAALRDHWSSPDRLDLENRPDGDNER